VEYSIITTPRLIQTLMNNWYLRLLWW